MKFIKKIHNMYKNFKNGLEMKEAVTDKTISKMKDEVNENTLQQVNGKAYAYKVIFDQDCIKEIKNRYITFDVETTGLNPKEDKIVEVGAVIFEDGIEKEHFESFINPKIQIPKEVTDINGITNEMLLNAPDEKEVCKKLCDFLGDAIRNKIVICAYNARFHMDFLCNTLKKNGIDANIYFLDTLELSRDLVENLENYKQATVAEHFQIELKNVHRAYDDAAVCGKIMNNLLEIKCKKIEKYKPNELEEEICKYIQDIIVKNGGNTDYLRFQRLSSGHIAVSYLYNFIKFKYGRNKYIIIPQKVAKKLDIETQKCSKTEGEDMVRYYFEKKEELDIFSEYIYKEFVKTQKAALSYMRYSEKNRNNAIKGIEYLANYND